MISIEIRKPSGLMDGLSGKEIIFHNNPNSATAVTLSPEDLSMLRAAVLGEVTRLSRTFWIVSWRTLDGVEQKESRSAPDGVRALINEIAGQATHIKVTELQDVRVSRVLTCDEWPDGTTGAVTP